MTRRAEEEEHVNHERWLISYADFITLLFAFFVVMYAISSVNEGRYRVLSDALSSAFSGIRTPVVQAGTMVPTTPYVLRRPETLADRNIRLQRARQEEIADKLSKALAPLVAQGQVRVTNTTRGVSVEINASVLFAPGQCVLEPEALKTLSPIANVLAGLTESVQVEGHTDNVPIATAQFPSNWELSSARAGSVVRYFISQEIAPGRLSAAGYSEYQPVAPNDTPEGRARNRRVTLVVLPAPVALPTETVLSPAPRRPSAEAGTTAAAVPTLSQPAAPPVSAPSDVSLNR